MKGLKALEENLEMVTFHNNEDLATYLSNYYIIEKELKALEIIKEKEVDIKAFNDLQDLQDYNYYCSPELTQEEYNLLKEVLHENVSKWK